MKNWIITKRKNMSKIKFQIIVIVVALLLSTVSLSLAYFASNVIGDAISKLTVNVGTTHQLTFSSSADISIDASVSNFAQNMGSLYDETTTSAQLIAGSDSTSATEYYSVIVNVESNNFEYTTTDETPELILEIKDPDGVLITSAEGLTYVEVTDAKTGELIKGFDMTEVIGISRIKTNYEISTTSDTVGTTQSWSVKMTFVNLDSDQNDNAGKTLDASVILTDDATYSTEAPFIELLETEYVTNNSGYSNSSVDVLVNVLDPNGSDLVATTYCVSDSVCTPDTEFTEDDLYYSVNTPDEELTESDLDITPQAQTYALAASSVETYNYDVQYKITLSNEGANVLCVLSENETTSATVCSREYYIDVTAPTLGEIILDGTIGENGWYTSIVNVTSTDSVDYGSGVASSTVDIDTIDYSSNSVLITLTAIDNAGNSNATTTTIKTDLEAPVIIGAENLNYYKGQSYDLLDGVTCTDDMSSKDTCEVLVKSSTLNINVAGEYSVTYSSIDEAGNESTQTITITVDADAPTINSIAAASGALNANGWANENFTVNITSTDNSGTGIKSTLYCTTTGASCTPTTSGSSLSISSEGENTVCALVTDNNGKSTTLCESGFNLDKTNPTVGTITANGTEGNNGWYISNVTISSSSGTDALSGHFSTSIDITSITSDTTGKTVTITTTDLAGNTSTDTLTVKVDTTSPTVGTINLTGTLGENNWYTSDVTITATGGSDATSGLASNSLSQTSITSNVSGQVITLTTTDNAGNASTTTKTIYVDKATPTISVKSSASVSMEPGTSVATTSYFSYSYGVSSGSISCNTTNTSSLAVGTHSVTCTVTGGNGKTASATKTIVVEDSLYNQILKNEGSGYTTAALAKTAIASKTTPDFSSVATTDEGLFATTDSDGTVYYFRGATEDNYVEFANMTWRILSLDEDGDIKLVLNDTIDTASIFTSFSDSTALSIISSWYDENIQVLNVYTTSSSYCTSYDAMDYIVSDTYTVYTTRTSSYTVSDSATGQEYSRFSLSSYDSPTLVNSYDYYENLSYGMISADEVVFAGGVWGKTNDFYFLNISKDFLTLTPYENAATVTGNCDEYTTFTYSCGTSTCSTKKCTGASFSIFTTLTSFYVTTTGVLSNTSSSSGIRPTITLSSDVYYLSGEGTVSSPYKIVTE